MQDVKAIGRKFRGFAGSSCADFLGISDIEATFHISGTEMHWLYRSVRAGISAGQFFRIW